MERLRRLYGRHRMLPECEGWRGRRMLGVRKAFQTELKIGNNGRNVKKLIFVQKNTKKCPQLYSVSFWLCGRYICDKNRALD